MKGRWIDYYKLIGRIENTIERSRRNPRCLYPHCLEKPIGSHIIAENTLKRIAEKSHVLTWLDVTGWQLAKATGAGTNVNDQVIDHLYEHLSEVGISDKRKVRLPLFCDRHDGPVFASLENSIKELGDREMALLAFRSICTALLNTMSYENILVEVLNEKGLYPKEEREFVLQQLRAVQMSDKLSHLVQIYGQLLEQETYTQIGSYMRQVEVMPYVAATYSFVPASDDESQAVYNGTTSLIPEDFVHFSLLPDTQGKSLCAISWYRGSQKAQRFLEWHRLHMLSDEELAAKMLFLAFESPTIYISPSWWRGLSEEERFFYTRIHRDANIRHAKTTLSAW